MRIRNNHVSWIPALAGMTVVLLALTVYAGTPPPKKKNKLKWLQDMSAGADSAANQRTTVAGVRGLEEVGTPPDMAVRDFKAIDRLDALSFKEGELQAFMKEGTLR